MAIDKHKILVTGGTGQVGRHLRDLIPEAVYLSSKDCNLFSREDVMRLFDKHDPQIVVHLAATVGGIVENMKYPYDYFTRNILMNTNVIDIAKYNDISQFIGVLSTCIYPDVLPMDHYPMKEDMLHLGPPTPTNFGYGYAKRCMAVQIDALNKEREAKHLPKFQYVTPCNLFGPYDKYNERSHFVGALLEKIKIAKLQGHKSIQLLGDGTPLRQFMYAGDLALAIKYCIDSGIRESFNVAPSYNMSIREIAEVALKVCDAEDLEISWTGTMSGQYRKDVSNEWMLKQFPTFPFTSLEDGLKKTWDSLTAHLNFKNEKSI